MRERLDEIDERVLYYPGVDTRNTTTPLIAQEVDETTD